MAFLGGLALLGSAGEAKAKLDREQLMSQMHMMSMQRQDALLQALRDRQSGSLAMPDVLAAIQPVGEGGDPGATQVAGGAPPAQVPTGPPQGSPPTAAPPAAAGGHPLNQLSMIPTSQAAGPPPGVPPPQANGIPSFADRYGPPGGQLTPPGAQPGQMQPRPVQTQAVSGGGGMPAFPGGSGFGKPAQQQGAGSMQYAEEDDSGGTPQQGDRGTQVAQNLQPGQRWPEGAELAKQILAKRPDLRTNPAFQTIYKGLEAEMQKRNAEIDRKESRDLRKEEFEDRKAAREEKKQANLEGPALDAAAEHYYKTGDFGGSGGYGERGQANKNAIMKRATELHPEDPVQNWPGEQQAFKARAAGVRMLETRGANLRLASSETKRLIPRVEALIPKVSPSQYPDINKIINMWQEKTGGEDIIAMGQALNSAKYVYARILKPTGVLNKGDIDSAGEILQKSWTQGQIRRALKQMLLELKSAEEGLKDAESEYGLKYGAPTEEGGDKGGGGGAENDPLGIR
jgi:hypothetical protein